MVTPTLVSLFLHLGFRYVSNFVSESTMVAEALLFSVLKLGEAGQVQWLGYGYDEAIISHTAYQTFPLSIKMKQTKFSKGDKVFAKMRAWPARIDGVADETPNKTKYHVYFYGTAETGVVEAKDICPYVRYKSKLIKRKENKNLSEAIIEIEEDMTPEELAELNAAQESGANESVKEDNNIVEEKAKKECAKIGDKRSISGSLKTQKDKTAAKSTPHLRKSTPPPPRPTIDDDETKGKDKSKDYLYAGKNTINEFKIPLKINRPNFINLNLAAEWDKMVLTYAYGLKVMIEDGKFSASAAHDRLNDFTQFLAAQFKKKQAEEQF